MSSKVKQLDVCVSSFFVFFLQLGIKLFRQEKINFINIINIIINL